MRLPLPGLPGVCMVCRRPLVWGGRVWREPGHREKHVCPVDRPTCNQWMTNAKERCARGPGHAGEHRTRYALDNALYMATGRRRAA